VLRLKNIAGRCSYDYRKQFLNSDMAVLMEGNSNAANGFWEGYTDNYIRVVMKANLDLKNCFISVKIKKINKDFCEGVFL
jgi:threonylcarbamoyladenosine tRNA methylthiotransferase MtaB